MKDEIQMKKEKLEKLDRLGALVYQLRCDISELLDYYDNELVEDRELVEVFNDEYPFEKSLDEVLNLVHNWDTAVGGKCRNTIKKINNLETKEELKKME